MGLEARTRLNRVLVVDQQQTVVRVGRIRPVLLEDRSLLCAALLHELAHVRRRLTRESVVLHGGLTRDERSELFHSMCATLAAIHKLDYRALGLADFGKPGNYFARQLNRWSKQWTQFRRGDDDNPALDRMVQWLGERLPESETAALCHGDFRIANAMFHKTEPRVIGVLDWELSTLGHPLVDLAFNSQAWRMAPDENGGLLGLPLDEMGIPTEQEFLELYYELSGATERLTRFHQVFAMFRGAVGSAGVAVRGDLGSGVLPNAARVGRHLARAYATRGVALIEEER